MEKEVKKEETSKNFYLTILQKIRVGKRPSQIIEDLNISKQRLNYYISFLKKQRIIAKKGYGTWEILKDLTEKQLKKEVKKRSKKKISLGLGAEKPLTNLHALQINFPILEGKVLTNDWEIRHKLNNWIPKYKNLDVLEGLTLKNNNNRSITVFAKTRNIKDLSEVDNLAFKIRAYVHEYFKNKEGVILDVMNCETKNLNLATEDKQSEEMIRKGERFELDLNKKAEKIFKKDKIKAKAWIDGSPFKFSAETNDKEWKREYLRMPFTISGLSNSMPAIQEYNKNILLHMKVQEEQLKTQKELQKLLKKLSSQEPHNRKK